VVPPTVAPAIEAPPAAAPPAADALADGVIEDVMDPYGPTDTPAAEAPPSAPPAAAPAAPTSTPPAAVAPTPAPAAPAAAKAPAAKSVKRKLSRKELNRALADFAALTRDIKIERAAGGGILVSDLAKGSFPARVGIQKGDIVRRVAGHAIDTVDDAASAYAAVMAAKQVVVEIERRGARLQLTYQLTD
jgi:S1-C subfamily serine protease